MYVADTKISILLMENNNRVHLVQLANLPAVCKMLPKYVTYPILCSLTLKEFNYAVILCLYTCINHMHDAHGLPFNFVMHETMAPDIKKNYSFK